MGKNNKMTVNWTTRGTKEAQDVFDALAVRFEKLAEDIEMANAKETDEMYRNILMGSEHTFVIDWQPVDKKFVEWALKHARYAGEDDYDYKKPRKYLSGELRKALR